MGGEAEKVDFFLFFFFKAAHQQNQEPVFNSDAFCFLSSPVPAPFLNKPLSFKVATQIKAGCKQQVGCIERPLKK